MNLKQNLLSIAGASILLWSCGNNEPAKTEEHASEGMEQPKEEVCTYGYDNALTGVFWTAYKYTEKAGVKGHFDTIMVSGTGTGQKPEDVLGNATFTIVTSSVNSDNPDRDAKIAEHFFGTMNTPAITGNITSMDGGNGTVNIIMNEVEKEIPFTYTMEDNTFRLGCEINVEDWNGGDGIAALNEVCKDLHTGTDGKSKLWPDVSIVVETTLSKECE